jgi:hypothetical protein
MKIDLLKRKKDITNEELRIERNKRKKINKKKN